VNPGNDVVLRAALDADAVLDQIETGVVVIDRQGSLLYANACAVTLFGFPDEAEHLLGRPLVSLGFEEGDARKAQYLADQVLRGRPWEGDDREPPGGRITGLHPGARGAAARVRGDHRRG
jgi:PAS domain-containing protein